MSIKSVALKLFALALPFFAVCLPLRAQESAQQPAQEEQTMTVEQFVKSLHFRSGVIEVPEAKARFNLNQDFQYLDKADARRVLEDMWGNPPDDDVLGLIVPRAQPLTDDDSWAVVVTYSDKDGYVKDADAAEINYDDLLKQMQKEVLDANPERKKQGYGTLRLVGWAVPPHYDSVNKKLHWAREVEFDGKAKHTLNYDIRVLGRYGYLSLNAVSAMSDLPVVSSGMDKLLPMTEFEPGARYADHNSSTDKIAAYGIAGLIGGGLAAKAGLFTKLGLLLAKFLKPLIVGVIALFAALRKWIAGLFGRGGGGKTVQ